MYISISYSQYKQGLYKTNRELCIYWGTIIWTMNEIYELKALYKGTETTELRVSFFIRDFDFLHPKNLQHSLHSRPKYIQLISRRARADTEINYWEKYQSITHKHTETNQHTTNQQWKHILTERKHGNTGTNWHTSHKHTPTHLYQSLCNALNIYKIKHKHPQTHRTETQTNNLIYTSRTGLHRAGKETNIKYIHTLSKI